MTTNKLVKLLGEVHEQYKARGNFGHAGRPGMVGGSMPGSGVSQRGHQMILDEVGSLVNGRDSGRFMVTDMLSPQVGGLLRANGFQRAEPQSLGIGRTYQAHKKGDVTVLHRDWEHTVPGKGTETLGTQIMFVDSNGGIIG